MVIKKTATPRGLPPIHPGLEQRLREAEEAERTGTTPRTFEGPQKVLRPSLDISTEERAWQARTIGLVDPVYRKELDPLLPLAEQEAFRPGEDLDAIWDTLSEADKVRAGATERFQLEMTASLRRAQRAWREPHAIGGRLDARNLKRSAENLASEIESFDAYLAPDSKLLLTRFVEETRELLELCLRERAVKGLDAPTLHGVLRDLVHKLVYQELVNRRRGMGDRGIRRICGAIELAETLYAQLTRVPGYSPRERLMMRLVHVHQNLGYTAYAARASFRGGRMHRAYGARIFTDEMNRFRSLVGPEELETLRAAVATHSSEELPLVEARVLALVRAVDHLTPFAPYRVYKHLEQLPGATDYLDDMLARARAGEREKFGHVRTAFRRFLAEGTDFPTALRDDLVACFRAFDRGADLVELGPLGGQVDELKIDPRPPGAVYARIACQPFAQRYQALFDLQQDQLVRLARASAAGLPSAGPATMKLGVAGFGALWLNLPAS